MKAEVRFAVTDKSGNRAASWKLRTATSRHGPEIYFACRELGAYFHTSFHATGEWHTKHETKKVTVDPTQLAFSKRVEKWERPSELVPGFTVAYTIVTSWSAPVTPLGEERHKLLQIPNAPTSYANQTSIVIVRPGDWQIAGAEVLWNTPLSSGETLVLTNKKIEMSSFPELQVVNSRNSDGTLRALLFGIDSNGHRFIFDAPVTPKYD